MQIRSDIFQLCKFVCNYIIDQKLMDVSSITCLANLVMKASFSSFFFKHGKLVGVSVGLSIPSFLQADAIK